jgi:hypothetical protein
MPFVTVFTGKGATPQQALAMIYGVPLLALITACVWVLDKPVAQAALIVMAVAAPRALLYLAAEWGQPVNGSLGSEMHEWRAMRPPS